MPIQRVIQRDAAPAGAPRSTLGVGEVVSGCWDFITDKLAKIWGNLWGTVKEMVIGVLNPWAIWKGLKEDWANMTKISRRGPVVSRVFARTAGTASGKTSGAFSAT